MNVLWSDETAAAATGGQARGASWRAGRVEIDSRRVQHGDLFVALKGEHHDGHDFVKDAFARGAAAAVVSNSSPHRGEAGRGASGERSLDSRPHPSPPPLGEGNYIVVADTQAALEALGRAGRARAKAKVVGVTGSVGKTSAKEMLRLALSPHGAVFASHGNFNNQIGLPLNLANLPQDADFAVIEMGMNHAGEIAHLTQLARPDVAAITNVEAVHLEFFDSVDGIARAKAEIFEGLEPGGIALLPADSAHAGVLQSAAEKRGARVVTFGHHAGDARVTAYRKTAGGCEVEAAIGKRVLLYRLSATGAHWAALSVMVLAAADALGLDAAKSAAALAAFGEPEGRGRVSRILGGKALLIDDSYNASPASMRAAFAKTAEIAGNGRRIAALGDMLELGAHGAAMHAALAEDLLRHGFSVVLTTGSHMRQLHDALPGELCKVHLPSPLDMLPLIEGNTEPGDIVLVKGSHGSKMHELAEALLAPKEKKHAL